MTPRDEIEAEKYAEFLAYVEANYKPGCVLSDPKWHAERWWRAARSALSRPPAPATEDSDDTPKCEGCDSPATTQDSDGVPLCAPCCEDAIVAAPATEAKCGEAVRCSRCGATERFNVYSYRSTDGQGHPLIVYTDCAGDGDRDECPDSWHDDPVATPLAGASEWEVIERCAKRAEDCACPHARDDKSSRYGFCGHARCGHFHEAADAIRALRPTPPPAETAVEAKRREFYEAARAEMDPANRPHNEHDHAAADRWSEAKRRKKAAYDAMLAAEAAERAERETGGGGE